MSESNVSESPEHTDPETENKDAKAKAEAEEEIPISAKILPNVLSSTEQINVTTSLHTKSREDSAIQCSIFLEEGAKSTSFVSSNTIPVNYLSSDHLAAGVSDLEKEFESFCRICHEVEKKESFISPCKCKGTISWVHKACVERWLAERDINKCEICGFSYNTIRVPKYNVFKAFYVWLTSDDTQRDRRDVALDLLGMSLFAPLVTTGTYVGLILADAVESLPPNEDNNVSFLQILLLASGRLTMLSVISLLVTVDVAYATWIAIRVQNHVNNWCSWFRRNTMVTLLPSSNDQHD
ncbi:E3 ubiquitin-protein ligase MARCHF3-like isoform X2 [Rhodnius prolixus]|uniref:E3 ubiquitin-protein ligase MARCHF3-like isoform X2 n=1 Tax=Rhodnius prolixus TaxID=13249 RepID=UPI003D188549